MQVELTEAVWLEDRGTLTLIELAECSGLTEPELRDLVDLGALAPLDPQARDWNFPPRCIVIARAACRLRHDFELDVQGLAVAMTLLERVQELEAELQRLQAHLPRHHRT